MANAFYDNYRKVLTGLGGNHSPIVPANDWELFLIDSADYTYDSTDEDEADIVTGAAIEERVTLSGVALANVADVDWNNPTFSSASGDPCEAMILVDSDGGAAASNALVLFLDTFSSGMPVTLNGGDVNVTIPANGIYNL